MRSEVSISNGVLGENSCSRGALNRRSFLIGVTDVLSFLGSAAVSGGVHVDVGGRVARIYDESEVSFEIVPEVRITSSAE